MPAQKTHEEFIRDIQYYYGDDYEITSQFINGEKPIKIRHKPCGTEWEIQSANKLISRGTVCPHCKSQRTYTKQDVQNNLKKFYNNEYELIKFNEKTQEATFKHKTCGREISVSPKQFFVNKKVCPDCKVNRNKVSIDDLIQYIKENANNEYTILSEDIINVNTHIHIRHDVCGHEYDVTPLHFKHGKRCPYCNIEKRRLNKNSIITKIKKADRGNEYLFKIPDDYKNVQSFIRFKHKSCNNIFSMRLADFLYHNQRCPYCNESRGEREIESILNKLNIKYKSQYIFRKHRCIYINDLKFDFVIKLPKTKRTCVIEFNGIQHYQVVDFFGGEEEFNNQKARDKVKKAYCKERNIPLMIIKYNQYKDIETLITNFIKRNDV